MCIYEEYWACSKKGAIQGEAVREEASRRIYGFKTAVEGMVGSGKAKEGDPACWKDTSKCTWFMYLIIAQRQVAITTLKRTLVSGRATHRT